MRIYFGKFSVAPNALSVSLSGCQFFQRESQGAARTLGSPAGGAIGDSRLRGPSPHAKSSTCHFWQMLRKTLI